MVDVVVVGAGPAGLHVATKLAQRGRSVVVCEEHDEIGTPVHCTGVLAHEAFASMDLPRDAILNPLSTVSFVSPSGQTFDYSTPAVEALVIDRGVFDRALAKRAAEAGARIVHGQRVVSVDVEAEGVNVATRQDCFRGRAVVLACGAQYAFQQRMTLGRPPVFLQSAQLELPAGRSGNVEVHFGSELAPRGFAWVVPVTRPTGSFARIGVMTAEDGRACFWRMVERVKERWELQVPVDADPGRRLLPLSAIRRTFSDRVLTVGDAAGLVKPTTGGGIYYSLASADIAADVLGDRLDSDDLSSESLAEYERRWRKQFKPEFDAQLALRMLAQRLSDAEIDSLFDLVATDGIMPIVRRSATFQRHRTFILDLLRHPPARRVLFRRVLGGAL